jgi:hypothetical protein
VEVCQTTIEAVASKVVGNGEAVASVHGSLRREIQTWKATPIRIRIDEIN